MHGLDRLNEVSNNFNFEPAAKERQKATLPCKLDSTDRNDEEHQKQSSSYEITRA